MERQSLDRTGHGAPRQAGRVVAGAGVLSAILLLPAAGCSSHRDDGLTQRIQNALAEAPPAGADLQQVVPGNWDRLCVFTPYTRPAQVDSIIGHSWREAPSVTGPAGTPAGDPEARGSLADGETLGTHALLAFTEAELVLHYVVFPRASGDFATRGPLPWYCLPRADAVFQMRPPIEGNIPWIGPVPRR